MCLDRENLFKRIYNFRVRGIKGSRGQAFETLKPRTLEPFAKLNNSSP